MNESPSKYTFLRINRKSIFVGLLFMGIWCLFLSIPPQTMAQSLDDAKRFNAQGLEYYRQGRYKEAIGVAEKALEIDREILGEKHPDTAAIFNNLGLFYDSIGDYTRAELLYQKALTIKQEVLGEKHPSTATSYNNLGMHYYSIGYYAHAEPLYQKALVIQKEVLGEKHPDTATIYNNLGELYRTIGDYARAKPLLQKSLAIRKDVLGEKHPDTATSYGNLGLLYDSMGDYARAEPLFQKALAICKEVLGEKHPDTATNYNNLGELYRTIGDYARAKPLLQKSLAIRKETLGEKHPDTAASYGNLGLLYYSIGDYARAEPLFQKALAINKEVLGEKHPDTATIYNNLGWLYEFMGDYARAEPLFQKVLAICKEVLGEKHPNTAKSYSNLGSLYYSIGDYVRTESLYQKALEIDREVLGEKHPDTATNYNNLGMFYISMGDYARAEPLYQKALAIRQEVLGQKHPDTATGYNDLGELYRAIGDYARAESLFQKSLAIDREVLGEKHPDTARIYNNLGNLYHQMGDYARAEPMFQKVMAIFREVLGEKHPDTATSYNNLGNLYFSMGDYARAESLFQKSLAIDREVLGEKHPDTARSYNNLGMLYISMGDYARAESLYQKALAIFREVLGEKHPDTATSYNNLGVLYVEKGDIDRATVIFKNQDAASGLGLCYLSTKDWCNAEKEFTRALGISEQGGEKEFIIGDHVGLGLALEGLGEYAGAKRHFKEAIQIMEDQWATLSFSARKAFLDGEVGAGFSRLDAYEGMVRVTVKEKKEGYPKESLLYAEQVKSRTLLEMLAARGAQGASKADQEVLSKDRDFQQKIAMLSAQYGKLRELGGKAPAGRIKETEKSLNNVRNAYERFINEVKLKNMELASLITTERVNVEEIQKLLDPSNAVVEYFTTKDKTYAWYITRDKIEVNEIDTAKQQILAMVNDLLIPNISNRPRKSEPKILLSTGGELIKKNTDADRNDNRKRFLKTTQKAYSTLIKPLESKIEAKNVIIVPHGVLHKVPFAALNNGDKFMVDKFSLTIVPSLSVIQYVAKKRNQDKGRFLAFVDPETDAVPLDFTQIEVESIEGFFPQRQIYSRDQATETRLKEQAASHDVIHFACHGEFNDKQPMQSGLLLSKDRENDGYFQVHEAFGLDLKNSNLVCLSACETGLSKVQGGDDMVGLSRGFIYAGTPSLMATLWSVDDKATSLLMKHFYDNWQKKGLSKPEALRQAQKTVKAMPGYEHPYYWAPYVMIGDWM